MKGFIVLVAVWAFPLVNLSAGEKTPAGQFGAHWARVSDRAQIQLIIDELRSATERGRDGIVRKHAALNFIPAPMPATQGIFSSGSGMDNIRLTDGSASVEFANGGVLHLTKTTLGWRIAAGTLPPPPSVRTHASRRSASGVSVGSTFIETPMSREHDIERLTRSATRTKLGKALFATADRTASYYSARYTTRAPFVSATYIQFVTDPEWNRVVYGNMNHWIKAYGNIAGPSCIAVDADGRVFIGETGKQQVTVLRVAGEGSDTHLLPLFVINNISNPTDVAWSDGGTPLIPSDDFLYVADASANTVAKYALHASGATRVAEFSGFDSPTSIVVGRWNGASNGLLYVVDRIGKRLRAFEDEGNTLRVVNELKGDHRQYFRSIKTDHFGNVYLVDNAYSQVFKYTSDLHLLDAQGGDETFAALGTVDIPFGKIEVEGEGTFWAGFDQLFALERWGEETGAQRRTLGLRLKDIDFSADADVSEIANSFIMTDYGDVSIRVLDAARMPLRTLNASWMVAGMKTIVWDRRDESGKQVPEGTYHYEIVAQSPYRDNPTVSHTSLSLPLYYWENSGSSRAHDNPHLVQGTAVAWGSDPSQTADEHSTSVQYRFSGLQPESEYEVAAEYVGNDGVGRMQDLDADGISLHGSCTVGNQPHRTGYLRLPKESYADGEVTISINRRGEGTAIVSQLWMKQVGVGFGFQPVDQVIPTAYALLQNYPNPFNPSTTIRYAIPVEGPVTLKVYNLAGQEVATLVNDRKTIGMHEVQFSAVNKEGGALASGVYFYRLQAGEFSDVKKFLVLK